MGDINDEIDIRYTEARDAKYLKKWLQGGEGVLRWFPMADDREIDDAVARWIGFSKFKCSLTAEIDGEPCGLATLYLQPYKKLAHQCEFGIICGEEHRGKGIGTIILNNLMHLAKEHFSVELIHLQVYEGNPAVSLYKRFGFKEYGRQTHWIKENDEFLGRIFMERFL
jgi:RimJ/RimL family protein N-acetyltransferase